MEQFKNLLKEKYTINDSIKEYKGYKVKSPEITIETIENAFKKIGLNIKYTPNQYQFLKPYSPFQSGFAVLYSEQNKDISLFKAGGKGVTPILSRASGTAELMERFTGYGLAQGHLNHYLSFFKYNNLWVNKRKKNETIVNEFPYNYIDTNLVMPEGFEETYKKLAKSVCYSLNQDKFYSYPEEFVTVLEGSNGMASGNTFEEATIHAINELIERLVNFYMIDTLPKFKKIKKDSFTHPTVNKLMEAIDSTGLEFEILDFSHIFDVPVIITIFDNPEWDLPTNKYTDVNCEYPKIVVGVDTDPQDAAMRCFTEMIQSGEPIFVAKSNYERVENKFEIAETDTIKAWKMYQKTAGSTFQNGNQALKNDFKKYLKTQCVGEKSVTEIKSMYDINHKVEIKNVAEALKKHNLEVYLHDLTHPLLQFPVVRAMFTGGEGYFSQLPFAGYMRLAIGTENKEEKYSFLNHVIKNIYGSQDLYGILEGGKWCSSDDQTEFINCVMGNLSFTGAKPPLWGKKFYKFYFLGILHLKMKDYGKAEKCFKASLYQNFNDIAPLIGLLYIYSKQKKEIEFKNIMDHINTINKDGADIEEMLKDMDNPVVDPNPFELCDLDCVSKKKPHLCENCFFNYVPVDLFMKDFIDDYIPT